MKINYYNIVWLKDICKSKIKINEKVFSILSHLQTEYHLKLDFENVDQHTGGTKTPQG